MQSKEVVCLVLLVEQRKFANSSLTHILTEVNEHMLYRSNYRSLYLLQERTGSVTVHEDRRNGGFVHLLDIGILALALVHHSIVAVLQIGVGKCHHVVLGDLLHLLHALHNICPWLVVDECLHEEVST